VADRERDKIFERRVAVDLGGKSWVSDGELRQLVEEVEVTVDTFDDC
jgi:hypothetical protein